MDLIYSRNGLRKLGYKKFNNKKNNSKKTKFITLLIVFLVAIVTFSIIFKSIYPIFEGLCIEKVKSIATIIMNEETNIVLNNLDYSKIVTIEKNEEDGTNIVKTDVMLINKIATDIALRIEERFKNLENQKIKIPIGALTGTNLLAGSGPGINIRFIKTGNITKDVKTEFKEQGINQTSYRVYLELRAQVNILTPYKTISKEITNQILLVETVIVGNVPETYYNLQGVNEEDLLNLVNN